MSAVVIANYVLLVTVISVWAVLRMYDLSFSLVDVDSARLRLAIVDGQACPFSLNTEEKWFNRPVDEIIVEGGRGSSFFVPEKLHAMLLSMGDSDALNQWIKSQLSVYHLYEEVLTSEKFWLTLGCVSTVNIAVFILVFEPISHIGEQDSNMRSLEISKYDTCVRKFISEKLLVISFVVVRSQAAIQREKRLPAGILAKQGILSDGTMFSIWYILIWSVSAVISTANRRLETGVQLVEADVDTSRTHIFPRLAAVVFCCLCASASMTSLAISSLQIIHPLYAAILITESLHMFIRSSYVFSRVVNRCYRTNHSEPRLYYIKRLTDILTDTLSAVTYLLFIVVGTLLNGKILPICFISRVTFHCARLTSHIYSHRQGHPASKFILD